MASTYSTNLAIELIGTGDQAGSWGNTTNTNLGTLIEQAISGYVTQAVSTGTDTTITIPNGATGVARNMYIELTGTGGASTNLIVPANKKLYFIFNNTSSGQVTVKVSGQTGVSVPNGKKMVLVSNGTDVVVAENYIADFGSNSATITNLTCTSLTLTNNPTFSAGTANGVLYLNGSKVATSGSALTFTGTNLGVGTSSPGALLQLGQDQATTDAAQLLLNDNASFRGEFGYSESGTTILHIANTYNDDASRFDIRMKGKTAADAKLTILGSGNVGIGTASPGAKLHVLGSNLVGIFAGTNANTVYTEYRYNSTTTSGFIGNGSSILSAAADSDFIVRSEGALKFATNGNNFRAVIDTSGNLGLGVTPSAWRSSSKALQIGGAGVVRGESSVASLSCNNYINSSNQDIYINTGFATSYAQSAGQHLWFTAPSGTINTAISFTQAMTLDASGNLLLGGTSTTQLDGVFGQIIGSSSKTSAGIALETAAGAYMMYTDSTDSLIFWDSGDNAARATISNTGNLGLGVTPDGNNLAKVFQLEQGFTMFGFSNTSYLSANAYYNSGWKYKSTAAAAYYEMSGANGHKWNIAASGTINTAISFTTAMTLDASGNLEIGGTFAQGRRLNVDSDNNGYTVSLLQTGAFNSGKLSGTVYAGYYDGSSITDMASIRGGKENTTSGNYAGMLAFYTRPNGGADTERARITSGGDMEFKNSSGTSVSFIGVSSTAAQFGNRQNDATIFYTNNTAVGRFTAAGDFLVGTTAIGLQTVRSMGFQVNAGCTQFISHSTADGSGDSYVEFGYNGTKIGSITQNGTTAVAYNTTSDYRLKTFISPVTGAGARLDALKPVEYEWKADGKRARGFFAHEFQQVYADSVTGEKDEVDAEGKPVYQAMQASTAEVIADLVAEIQSLRSRVAALEAK